MNTAAPITIPTIISIMFGESLDVLKILINGRSFKIRIKRTCLEFELMDQ